MKKVKIPKEYRDLELEKLYREQRQEAIYQQVKLRSRIKKVNRSLRALQKEGYYDESVAVENIFDLLESKPVNIQRTKSGYISLKGLSSKTQTQYTAINKSINEFFKNKTSTVSGFEELYEERREELFRMFDDKGFVKNLTNKELRDIYKVFQSNEYDRKNKRFSSKDFFTQYTSAIDNKWSKEKFEVEMNKYFETGNDPELKKAVSNIYDKYISNFANR